MMINYRQRAAQRICAMHDRHLCISVWRVVIGGEMMRALHSFLRYRSELHELSAVAVNESASIRQAVSDVL